MRFLEPWYALLLLPVLAGLWWSWPRVAGMAKPRKRFAFVLRALVAASFILALMGPQWRYQNQGLAVVFVLDRSDSIRENDRISSEKFVRDAINQLGTGDEAAVVAFGRQGILESVGGGRRSLPAIQSKVDGTASDLASGIRLASAVMPEGKGRRIVVLSDGNETLGNVGEAVQTAKTDGIQVDWVPLKGLSDQAEAAVIDVSAPGAKRADEPFDLRVAIESSAQQTGTLTLDRDGMVVEQRKVTLPQGRSSFLLPQRLAGTGFFRYRVTLQPDRDSDNRNNIGSAFVSIKGKSKILVVQKTSSRGELVTSLRQQGLAVDVRGPASSPIRIEDLQPYDAIVLNDVNAADVPLASMDVIQRGVRDAGIGMAMVGGEDSFLPGGWYGTPVAEALPVDLNVRQRKNFPSTSILIMVDASGSMGMIEAGVPKIRLAANAAEQTARLLTPRDRLGVAGSSDGIEFVLPFGELTDKDAAINNIRKLGLGGGGIFAEPTILRAEKELGKESSKVRHFILVADGADTDTYGSSLQILARMRANKITTTVVAIGEGKDTPFLRQAAAVGGGNFYQVTSAGKLPAIFTQDVSLITRSAIEEGVFIPRMVEGEEILRGVADGGLPALYAYCLTDARPLARTSLRSAKNDPILASWQYGLGKSLAFTSDAQSRWAAQWVPWGGFGSFWSQAIRSISRRTPTDPVEINTQQVGGQVKVRLQGEGVSASTKVILSGPDGKSEELKLSQEGPDSFEATASAREMGSYLVSVAGAGQGTVSTSGFAVSYPPEYRTFAGQEKLMANYAEQGIGSLLDKPEKALRPLTDAGESIKDMWFWFVLGGLLLIPLDVAVRRVALPLKEIIQKSMAGLKKTKAVPQPENRLERLKSAKQKLPEETSPVKEVITPRPQERTEKRQAPSTGADSARSRLLDAKRRRKESDDS